MNKVLLVGQDILINLNQIQTIALKLIKDEFSEELIPKVRLSFANGQIITLEQTNEPTKEGARDLISDIAEYMSSSETRFFDVTDREFFVVEILEPGEH